MQSSFSLLATVLVVLAASAAHAQCAFNAPAKARGIKADMVRAYSACPRIPCPGVSCFPPNTTTMAGVPACGPPVSVSSYTFGPRGQCRLSIRHRIEVPCSTGIGVPCSEIATKVRCKDIRDSITGEPIADGTWSLSVIVRGTVEDSGDLTLVDSSVQLLFEAPRKGSLKLDAKLPGPFNTPPFDLFPPSPDPWYPCSSVEILSVAVNDPAGNTFATLGSSTR